MSEPETPPQRLLPEGYYLENFEAVLSTVRERYGDLLAADELAFLADWQTLSRDARRLYVRLVSRKGPSFRRDRIRYDEIADLDAALDELDRAGFADDAGDQPAEELLDLLLRDELQLLARELLEDPPPRTARKDELLIALAEDLDDDALDQAVRQAIEIVRPLGQEEVLVFRLLFFGNLSQDWTEFVLRDLGVVRFEPYDLRTDLRLFPTRGAVDDVLALELCRAQVRFLLAYGELDAALGLGSEVLERQDWDPAARRPLDSICNRLGRALERLGRAEPDLDEEAGEAALELYAAAVTPPARERRTRVLARHGRLDEALLLCAEIAADPRDETEAEFAPRFARDLRRRRGEAVEARRRPRRPTRELRLIRQDGHTVEDLTLAAFAGAGRHGFFAENWLWKSLFGLAFWDVIFAPIAGAFQHPFQYGPLDLMRPDFRQRRSKLVEERLAELRDDPEPGPRLLSLYDEKRDTASRLVAWGDELRVCLELALGCLTGRQLALVCDRLSRDVGRYRRGFPDLFVLRDQEPGFELLEVKAPGDQLRPEQGAWIDYLNAHGIPASILRVQYA